MGVMFEFCDLSVNLMPVIYSSLHVSGLTVRNDYLSEFCLLTFLNVRYYKFKGNFSCSRM